MSPVNVERLALAVLSAAYIAAGERERCVLLAQETWETIVELTDDGTDDNGGKV